MSPIRLLLVDQHKNVRTQLVTRLKREADFEVVAEASNGKEAIERALNLSPDVILVDPVMQGDSGLELLRQLKKYLPTLVVVVLTAIVDTSLLMDLRKMGIKHVLTKGVETQQLIEILREVAQARKGPMGVESWQRR